MSWNNVEKDIEKGPMGLMKWIIIIAVLFSIVFGSLGFVKKYLSVNADRIITKNSFQYKEGMEQRAAILQANIDELDILIAQNPENKQDFVNQRLILKSQLKAITVNQ